VYITIYYIFRCRPTYTAKSFQPITAEPQKKTKKRKLDLVKNIQKHTQNKYLKNYIELSWNNPDSPVRTARENNWYKIQHRTGSWYDHLHHREQIITEHADVKRWEEFTKTHSIPFYPNQTKTKNSNRLYRFWATVLKY